MPVGDKFSLAFHAGYSWGDYWDADGEVVDYAVQGNYTAGNFTMFGKFTGTDASDATEVHPDSEQQRAARSRGRHDDVPLGRLIRSASRKISDSR